MDRSAVAESCAAEASSVGAWGSARTRMSWSKERFSSKRNVTFSSMSLDDGTNAPSFSMMLCSDISFLFSLGVQ